MNPLKTEFVRAFARTAYDGWLQGWHECNGGNLSYRLRPNDVAIIQDAIKPKKWQPLSVEVPELAGKYFLVTASGSFFRNVELRPKECFGIIQLDSEGKNYRKCWGFARGKRDSANGEASGQPTSELASHMLIHAASCAQVDQVHHSRVVYHAHPVNTAAITHVLPSESGVITKALNEMLSECAIALPNGVGVLGRMQPGTAELGRATADLMRLYDAVIWTAHGSIACAPTFDQAFGRIHTIEKAASIYLKQR